jgi:hypothetical protein
MLLFIISFLFNLFTLQNISFYSLIKLSNLEFYLLLFQPSKLFFINFILIVFKKFVYFTIWFFYNFFFDLSLWPNFKSTLFIIFTDLFGYVYLWLKWCLRFKWTILFIKLTEFFYLSLYILTSLYFWFSDGSIFLLNLRFCLCI